MRRLIEIYDDNKEYKELSSEDLPLEVYLLNEKKNDLIISPINEREEDEENNIYGYIAEEEEHIG